MLVHHLLTHTAGWESAQRTHRIEASSRPVSTPPPPDRDPSRTCSCRWRSTRSGSRSRVSRWSTTTGPTSCSPRSSVAKPAEHSTRRWFADLRTAGNDAERRHRRRRPPAAPRDPGRGAAVRPGRPVTFEGDPGSRPIRVPRRPHLGSRPRPVRPDDPERRRARRVRVLAPSTVTAMVTNQIPGVPARFADGVIPEASWGYGFTVVQEQRFPYFAGGLVPFGSVLHPGAVASATGSISPTRSSGCSSR